MFIKILYISYISFVTSSNNNISESQANYRKSDKKETTKTVNAYKRNKETTTKSKTQSIEHKTHQFSGLTNLNNGSQNIYAPNTSEDEKKKALAVDALLSLWENLPSANIVHSPNQSSYFNSINLGTTNTFSEANEQKVETQKNFSLSDTAKSVNIENEIDFTKTNVLTQSDLRKTASAEKNNIKCSESSGVSCFDKINHQNITHRELSFQEAEVYSNIETLNQRRITNKPTSGTKRDSKGFFKDKTAKTESTEGVGDLNIKKPKIISKNNSFLNKKDISQHISNKKLNFFIDSKTNRNTIPDFDSLAIMIRNCSDTTKQKTIINNPTKINDISSELLPNPVIFNKCIRLKKLKVDDNSMPIDIVKDKKCGLYPYAMNINPTISQSIEKRMLDVFYKTDDSENISSCNLFPGERLKIFDKFTLIIKKVRNHREQRVFDTELTILNVPVFFRVISDSINSCFLSKEKTFEYKMVSHTFYQKIEIVIHSPVNQETKIGDILPSFKIIEGTPSLFFENFIRAIQYLKKVEIPGAEQFKNKKRQKNVDSSELKKTTEKTNRFFVLDFLKSMETKETYKKIKEKTVNPIISENIDKLYKLKDLFDQLKPKEFRICEYKTNIKDIYDLILVFLKDIESTKILKTTDFKEQRIQEVYLTICNFFKELLPSIIHIFNNYLKEPSEEEIKKPV
ncbi:hypothetical protein CDIK_3176 [Cucumispora dikerogammari]|nr:hypothetical protein CDIK_3176 [Cucumispora dikerogammari]